MMKMLLTGEPIKAKFAKEIGLINDYYSKSKLDKEVFKVAKTIASKSNFVIMLIPLLMLSKIFHHIEDK